MRVMRASMPRFHDATAFHITAVACMRFSREFKLSARPAKENPPQSLNPQACGGRKTAFGCAENLGRAAENYFRTASLNAFDARSRTTVLALILMASPVCGLRPMRALRCAFTARPMFGITNLPAPPLHSYRQLEELLKKERGGLLRCATLFGESCHDLALAHWLGCHLFPFLLIFLSAPMRSWPSTVCDRHEPTTPFFFGKRLGPQRL